MKDRMRSGMGQETLCLVPECAFRMEKHMVFGLTTIRRRYNTK
ncbi:Uncharacterised protein [Porphyromonas cangingivalis]|nr:Uncharacterised protein [Porphyromonas cangingivalis]